MNFKETYNRGDFLGFIKDFLPSFNKDIRQINLESGYSALKKAELLGICDDLELSVIQLKIEGNAEKKIYQANEGFRLMKEHQIYRALVVYEGEADWRLSLMTMSVDKTETGRTTQKFSNPRRYSFYLGPQAKTKTPEKFLLAKGKIKDFDDLVSRFDVEIVTKEFFAQYKKLFINLLEHLKQDKPFLAFANQHGVQLEIFSKKILGQIVFIYFLQRKGWLGSKKGEHISSGDKGFLRSLFIKSNENYQNYFNEYLEPLFYDCLNNKPEMAASFFRSRFDCQIPFLNGGLFEPINSYKWQDEFINIPNEIFSNDNGTGILDIFDLFNFTINENTPDDQEVSVDPEMLGKVFENLIEDNIRKGQGAYYTPREIVHYMCQESLLSYLVANSQIAEKSLRTYLNLISPENEDLRAAAMFEGEAIEIETLLKNIKVCDSACGSGAFLIGMLNEIIKFRILLRMFHPRKLESVSIYHMKKEAIQNSLYGVDIDPGAIDIAKLRFWLSIVVDEDIDEIEPLPNLDYKLMQGNSLLDDLVVGDSTISFNFNGYNKIDRRTKEMKNLFEINRQAKLFLDKSETLTEKLEKLHTEYFNVHDAEKKKILKQKIDSIEDELIKSKCQEEINHTNEQIFNNIEQRKNLRYTQKLLAIKEVLNKWNRDQLRPFFPWRLHFGEVFNRDNPGFDVIIGNPPYIKENINKSAFQNLKDLECYQGKMDIWYLFGAKGLDILRDDGVISFIATNNWTSNDGASRFRNKIIKESQLKQFMDFGNFKVFSAGIQTMVFMILKNKDKDEYNFIYSRLNDKDATPDQLKIFLNNNAKAPAELYNLFHCNLNRESDLNNYINFIPDKHGSLLDKIKSKGAFHLNNTEIFSGIDVMQDILNKKHTEKLQGNFKVGQGVFVLSDEEKDELKLNIDEESLVKPYYTTKEIHRYYSNPKNNKWIIYSSAHTNKIINKYPNIKSHLDQYQKIITSVNRPYGLHRTRDENIFLGEKILSIRKCAEPSFSYVEFPCYISRAFLVIKTDRINLLYLLGILNSRIVKYWLRYKGKMQGDNFQVDKDPILSIPIIIPEQGKLKIISGLVSDIIRDKQQKDHSNISPLENRINHMIYKSYDLTHEEIKIIEEPK
jgi:hypothetical protein